MNPKADKAPTAEHRSVPVLSVLHILKTVTGAIIGSSRDEESITAGAAIMSLHGSIVTCPEDSRRHQGLAQRNESVGWLHLPSGPIKCACHPEVPPCAASGLALRPDHI